MSGTAPAGYNPASTLPLPSGGGPEIATVRGGGKGDDVAISGSGFPNDGANPVLRYDITKKQYMLVVTKDDGSKYAIYDANLGTLQTRASEIAEGSYTPSVSGALPSAPLPLAPLPLAPDAGRAAAMAARSRANADAALASGTSVPGGTGRAAAIAARSYSSTGAPLPPPNLMANLKRKLAARAAAAEAAEAAASAAAPVVASGSAASGSANVPVAPVVASGSANALVAPVIAARRLTPEELAARDAAATPTTLGKALANSAAAADKAAASHAPRNTRKGGKKTRKQKLRKNKRATRYLS